MNVKNRLKLYEKGESKFIREFDAISYAKNMRNLNTLVTSMMDDSERFMIGYQKRNAISFDTETESDHSDEDPDSIPKMFSSIERKKTHQDKVDDFMVG